MRNRILSTALVLAALVTLGAFAPARPSAQDPITGKWTGALLPEDADSRDVVFDLKYDGKQTVAGSFTGLTTPGDVRKGTFDAGTGALHLELSEHGESDVLITLDGRVADGVVTGGMTGIKAGRFRLERQKAARH